MTTTTVPASTVPQIPVRRRGRSALDTVILVGLCGAAANYTMVQLIERTIIPPALATSVVYVICAVVVAAPWRWSALVPLILCPLAQISAWASGFPEHALTHPGDHLTFVVEVLDSLLILMVIGACVVSLVQMLRHEMPHAPRWMTPTLTALAGLAIGALLVGTTAQLSTGGGLAASAAGSQSVHLTANRFSPDIVALHKGETLTIVDDSPSPHTLSNGSWSADNQPAPSLESGAPVINNDEVKIGGTSVVGPFATPGVYHLYCTIHPGMMLTILVQ